ncbi:hypothetical protein Pan97_34790 [Bremerella volcania]|uniref:Uncharacterized protein n=1 Tax=Bremerella volcania TaxID=2527984 RepID=A0A518CB50_9BACT|nr:hypothetical protein [Bremerella volcania]QDU76430.1 hypothetical protein Pan97_34790 [Bremerella volcania]
MITRNSTPTNPKAQAKRFPGGLHRLRLPHPRTAAARERVTPEWALLACLVVDPNLVDLLPITPDLFTDPAAQAVAAALLAVQSRGPAVYDLDAFSHELSLVASDGPALIRRLRWSIDATDTTQPAEWFGQVQYDARKRMESQR